MASRSLLLRRQRSWARRAGKTVDAAGYLPTVSDNLRQPLSATALADFAARGAAEFHDADTNVPAGTGPGCGPCTRQRRWPSTFSITGTRPTRRRWPRRSDLSAPIRRIGLRATPAHRACRESGQSGYPARARVRRARGHRVQVQRVAGAQAAARRGSFTTGTFRRAGPSGARPDSRPARRWRTICSRAGSTSVTWTAASC